MVFALLCLCALFEPPRVTDKIVSFAEIAYLYRYVTNNGRSQGPQWSIRQSAVYQKMNMSTRCSAWILIQPSDSALKRFKDLLLDLPELSSQPMTPHLALLNATEMDWKGYTSQLRLSIQSLVSTKPKVLCIGEVTRLIRGLG